MRTIEVNAFGGPEVLEFREVDDPIPPEDGYVVQIMAAGLNFADIVERRGRYKKDQPLPGLLGKEAAGVVVARGPAATRFDLGDPVIVIRFGNGCYADKVAAAAHEVLTPPRGLSFVEMAAFGTAYATAWFAMHEIARVRPGEAVLIQAAAGGVGSAAITLARTHGCSPIIGTAGGPEKCAIVRSRGADACLDYTATDFRAAVAELTDGRGVAYCLESVGGETYERSLEVMAPMGSLVVIGFTSVQADYANAIPRLHPLSLFHRSISVGGLNIDNLSFQRHTATWDQLVAHVEEHHIRPAVGQVFAFDDIQDAHALLESRRSVGKVVLSMEPAYQPALI